MNTVPTGPSQDEAQRSMLSGYHDPGAAEWTAPSPPTARELDNLQGSRWRHAAENIRRSNLSIYGPQRRRTLD